MMGILASNSGQGAPRLQPKNRPIGGHCTETRQKASILSPFVPASSGNPPTKRLRIGLFTVSHGAIRYQCSDFTYSPEERGRPVAPTPRLRVACAGAGLVSMSPLLRNTAIPVFQWPPLGFLPSAAASSSASM
jgi:hypothetical protein